MQNFIHVLDAYLPFSTQIVGLLFLLFAIPVFVVYTSRARDGARPSLRPISAFEKLERLVCQAAESGSPVHVAVGTGGIGTAETPETLMGLVVLDYVARRAAINAQAIKGTVGDPASLGVAQGIAQQALREAGYFDRYDPAEIAFYGPQPLAYAAGALELESGRPDVGAILLGRFGIEGLWLAEASAEPNRLRLGGTAQPAEAALLQASLDDYMSGEEVFAAGAYLHRPSHLGSLQTQDALRALIMALIIIGTALVSTGVLR